MTDAFSGIRLKLARARNQIEELKAECIAYLSANPYHATVHFDRTTRILTLTANIKKTPDPLWGVKIGEIIHNLRSAMDHVVWELVILTTGRPPNLPSKNQFPIFKNEEGFDRWGVPVHLSCVRQDAVNLIKSEQPFSTREHARSPLWHLSELSNADKHRTLHLTGTMLTEYRFDFPPVLEPMTRTALEVATKGPIQQDAVLWRGHLSGNLPWPFASGEVKGNLAMNIAFDEATPAVGGWLVIDTIADIANRTHHVLRRLGKEIFELEP